MMIVIIIIIIIIIIIEQHTAINGQWQLPPADSRAPIDIIHINNLYVV